MSQIVKLNPTEIEAALAVFANADLLRRGYDYTVEWLGDGSVEIKFKP